MLKYIETDSENSRVTDIISAPDERTMLTKLKRHFASMYDDPDEQHVAQAIRSTRDLEELGASIDYTYGWGENDIKVGHLIEELPDGTFRQVW